VAQLAQAARSFEVPTLSKAATPPIERFSVTHLEPAPQPPWLAAEEPTAITAELELRVLGPPRPAQEQTPSVEKAPRPLNLVVVRGLVGAAATLASGICGDGKTTGTTHVAVTIAPSGRATGAVLQGGPFNGTPVGSCISNAMRGVTVPPFVGVPIVVGKAVTVR
jgi:Mrp family chromosome partitioning ATPase